LRRICPPACPRARIVAEAVRIIRKPRIEEIEEEELPPADKTPDIEEELKALEDKSPFDDEDEIPF